MSATLSQTAAGKKKASSAAAAAGASASGAANASGKQQKITTHTSWCRTILLWGIIFPIVSLVALTAVACAYKYKTLQVGQPFSLISNQTVIDRPSAFHSRYRGPEYLKQYDRFFFQWWNFLVYDAETHDHWTLVYHTTKYSSQTGYAPYALASLIHKTRATTVLHGADPIPLEDLVHERDWDIGLRKPDGSIPHKMTILDDDRYNVVGDISPDYINTKERVRWNLTFERVHGMYSNVDNEEGNHEHCAIVSTLFGYHSTVHGWIEEGGKRFEFPKSDSKRYRAYAAGSWGCRLPAGYPEINYPWTWFWLSIPGDKAKGTPDIGMAMGTANFQTNSSLIGDLYGGFASVGIDEEIVTSTFARFHYNSSLQLPLTQFSTDKFLSSYTLGYDKWVDLSDEAGKFTIPLVQVYTVTTEHYRFEVTFDTKPELYFRLPVVVEHYTTDKEYEAAKQADKGGNGLEVFSDFRACGVTTHVNIWKRSLSPAAQLEARKAKQLTAPAVPSAVSALGSASVHAWRQGGFDSVVYQGTVESLNAIEFAYQAPVHKDVFKSYTAPQKFATK